MPRARGLLAGLFLAGLALRPQIVGVGPLIPKIERDLAVSHTVAGLLGTIPVLCMGLFALPAPAFARRHGSRLAITASLASIGVFGVARAASPGAAAVIVLTFGVGLGLGVAQALMPVAVKERFSSRPAFATGVYVLGMNIGSAVSSVLAVPIADAAGSWRWALAAFSAATLLLVVVWARLVRPEEARRSVHAGRAALPLGSALGWRLVGIFGSMASLFYGLNAWLPDAYVERGWSDGRAGALLGVLNAAALASSAAVPWLADRGGSRRLYLAAFSALAVLGCSGFVLLPGGAFFWAALVGLCTGVTFPLAMTLPVDIGRRPAEVGAIAGMMLGVGYSIGAVAPLGLGAARDATGSYTVTLWLVVACAGLLFALSAGLSRERMVQGVA